MNKEEKLQKKRATDAIYMRKWRAKNLKRSREIARKGQRKWYSKKIKGNYKRTPEQRMEIAIVMTLWHQARK